MEDYLNLVKLGVWFVVSMHLVNIY